jgi:hypothetical protein
LSKHNDCSSNLNIVYLFVGKPENLGTIAEFFKVWHLKEVLVVVISHLIINLKKINFMEILIAVIVHITIGFILTFLSVIIAQIGGGVGIAGGSVNQLIICAKF